MNIPYERYEFRHLKQEQSETVEKCLPHRLRAKLLEKDGLTLGQLRLIATTMDLSDMQG